jgi:hypothetical protein
LHFVSTKAQVVPEANKATLKLRSGRGSRPGCLKADFLVPALVP